MKKILALVLALVMCIGCASAFAEKVGVSMPTKDLQRWNQDGEYMEKLLGEAGYEVESKVPPLALLWTRLLKRASKSSLTTVC